MQERHHDQACPGAEPSATGPERCAGLQERGIHQIQGLLREGVRRLEARGSAQPRRLPLH